MPLSSHATLVLVYHGKFFDHETSYFPSPLHRKEATISEMECQDAGGLIECLMWGDRDVMLFFRQDSGANLLQFGTNAQPPDDSQCSAVIPRPDFRPTAELPPAV